MAINVKPNGDYTFELRSDVDPKFACEPDDLLLSHDRHFIAVTNKGGKAGAEATSSLLHIYRSGRCVLVVPMRRRGPVGLATGYSGFLLPVSSKESAIRSAFLGLRAFFQQNRNKRFELQQSVWRKSAGNAHREALILRIVSEYFSVDLMPSRVLDLAALTEVTEEKLLALYDQKVRNQIRNAKTSEMEIVAQDLHGEAAIPQLLELLTETHACMDVARQATKMRTRELQRMNDEFSSYLRSGGRVVFGVSRVSGKCISANIFVLFNGIALYHTAFCLDEYKKTNIMPVLMHRNILESARSGAEVIELGRVIDYDKKSLNLDAYKAQFGNDIRFALRIRYGWIWIPDWVRNSFGRSF